MSLRLDTIKSHFSFSTTQNLLDQYLNGKLNKNILREAYLNPSSEITQKLAAETMNCPLFDTVTSREISRERQLEIVLRQLIYLYPKFYEAFDFENSINRAILTIAFTEYDPAIGIRFFISYLLFVETIDFLGTSKHFQLMKDTLKLKHYGCFAMTELGHGSNVAKIETTATFDKETHEFTINSPTPTASK